MQSITKFTVKTKNMLKHTSSVLSLPDSNIDQLKKKSAIELAKPVNLPNMERDKIDTVDKVDKLISSRNEEKLIFNEMDNADETTPSGDKHRSNRSELEKVIGPLVTEFKLLRE